MKALPETGLPWTPTWAKPTGFFFNWSSGVVEYKFYSTFSTSSKEIVLRAMEYTCRIFCITFLEATELAAKNIPVTRVSNGKGGWADLY